MSSRIGRYLLLALALLVMGNVVAVVVYINTRPKFKINKGAADLIRPGMSEEEATSFIGAPPGNYDYSIWWLGGRKREMEVFYTIEGTKYRLKWTGSEGVLYVFVGKDDRVICSQFFPF